MIKSFQKKYIIMVLLTVFFVLNPVRNAVAAGSPAGKILRIKGTVVIVRNGKTLKGSINSKVYPLDEIKTGSKSMVELTLRDGSSLHLGPDTALDLTQYKFSLMSDNPSFIARITKGIFVYISGAISKVHPGSVKFETPDATIGIRGTKLVVKVIEANSKASANGKTITILFKDPNGKVGSVVISNSKGEQTLNKENYSVTVNRGSAPSKPIFIDKKALEQMIPPVLYEFVFGNYAPPLGYTERIKPLGELDFNLPNPPEDNPISPSTP
ncbi:MAG: FecR family protein [Desulfobacula sp.]|nr:FecR family protein [Desulfobacula sp.]